MARVELRIYWRKLVEGEGKKGTVRHSLGGLMTSVALRRGTKVYSKTSF